MIVTDLAGIARLYLDRPGSDGWGLRIREDNAEAGKRRDAKGVLCGVAVRMLEGQGRRCVKKLAARREQWG